MSFTLGMLGPIRLEDFRDHLPRTAWRDGLPKGLGGSPVNLLCRELLRRGQRIVVMTLDPTVERETVVDGDGLRICFGPFRPRRARDFFALERRYLVDTIRRERPDVLHAQWTYEYALAAQDSGCPHVITAHDAPLKILRHNFIPYRIARTLMAYRVVGRARRIVAVSPYVADHLRRFMCFRGTSEIVSNGLPDELFTRRRATVRSGRGVTYATVLNGWGKLKNGKTAIEAFARVRRRRPADRLIMLGDGHGAGEGAAAWARGRGMDAGIEFVGSVTRERLLDVLTGDVDVLVHPSLEESQGMALIEAMALGIPVIGGYRSGAVPWTLDEGRAGLLVDVASAQAMADAMLRLGDSAAEREAWGDSGKRHAARHFHIRAVADAYQAVYSRSLEHA